MAGRPAQTEVGRPLGVVFGPSVQATTLSLAVPNNGEPEPAHVHVWEVVIELVTRDGRYCRYAGLKSDRICLKCP